MRSHNLAAVNTSETKHEQFYGIQSPSIEI